MSMVGLCQACQCVHHNVFIICPCCLRLLHLSCSVQRHTISLQVGAGSCKLVCLPNISAATALFCRPTSSRILLCQIFSCWTGHCLAPSPPACRPLLPHVRLDTACPAPSPPACRPLPHVGLDTACPAPSPAGPSYLMSGWTLLILHYHLQPAGPSYLMSGWTLLVPAQSPPACRPLLPHVRLDTACPCTITSSLQAPPTSCRAGHCLSLHHHLQPAGPSYLMSGWTLHSFR